MVGKRRKKALHKDFWQEIRKSRARFISIFCIVALGVAFFSGIQASSPDMRLSGDDYYNEVQLMDLKIVGTLGLTEDDIEAVRECRRCLLYRCDLWRGKAEGSSYRICESECEPAHCDRGTASSKEWRMFSGFGFCIRAGI